MANKNGARRISTVKTTYSVRWPKGSIQDKLQLIMKRVPKKDLKLIEPDAAHNHDHYIYGWPKRK